MGERAAKVKVGQSSGRADRRENLLGEVPATVVAADLAAAVASGVASSASVRA